MSSICLCISDIKEKNEFSFYRKCLTVIANRHKRGIGFCIDWEEPIVDHMKTDCFIANLLDDFHSGNCEMLLLPDGWYYNGYTNNLPFEERVRFLRDIANALVSGNHSAEFYIGWSGTEADEFLDVTVKCQNLIDYLVATIGKHGVEEGKHIIVTG